MRIKIRPLRLCRWRMWSSRTLCISDEALSLETGRGTEFVVVMNGEPQGGLSIRRRRPEMGPGSSLEAIGIIIGGRRSVVRFPLGESNPRRETAARHSNTKPSHSSARTGNILSPSRNELLAQQPLLGDTAVRHVNRVGLDAHQVLPLEIDRGICRRLWGMRRSFRSLQDRVEKASFSPTNRMLRTREAQCTRKVGLVAPISTTFSWQKKPLNFNRLEGKYSYRNSG
jgi:hypothetical protein